MKKIRKTKKFDDFFFNELFKATQKTLEKLTETDDWKIEKHQKTDSGKWVVQAFPESKLVKFHFLPKGAYKKLVIFVSEKNVSAECADNWPKFTFDFLNRKKRVLNKFFEELEAMLEKDSGR